MRVLGLLMADAESERAASATRNARARELLVERARACVVGPSPPA